MSENGIDTNKKIKLLYIDDEENNLTALKARFRREFEIDTAISANEARNLMIDNVYEVITRFDICFCGSSFFVFN